MRDKRGMLGQSETRYICINGHNEPKPGRAIGGWRGQTIYECRVSHCRAEAEPVTREEAETHR